MPSMARSHDGWMSARVLPNWSGDVLDLVVDFVTYVFVPAYAITASGLLAAAGGAAARRRNRRVGRALFRRSPHEGRRQSFSRISGIVECGGVLSVPAAFAAGAVEPRGRRSDRADVRSVPRASSDTRRAPAWLTLVAARRLGGARDLHAGKRFRCRLRPSPWGCASSRPIWSAAMRRSGWRDRFTHDRIVDQPGSLGGLVDADGAGNRSRHRQRHFPVGHRLAHSASGRRSARARSAWRWRWCFAFCCSACWCG